MDRKADLAFDLHREAFDDKPYLVSVEKQVDSAWLKGDSIEHSSVR